jgi:hypothetical protein
LEKELAFLRQTGFEAAFGQLVHRAADSGFVKDRHHLPKTALMEKYGTMPIKPFAILKEVIFCQAD